jgi:hypothetical protein
MYPFDWHKATARSQAEIPTNHRVKSLRYIKPRIIQVMPEALTLSKGIKKYLALLISFAVADMVG